MSDTSQTPYTPAEAAFAARVSKEAGAEAVFVFAYNLTFDNAYTDEASRRHCAHIAVR